MLQQWCENPDPTCCIVVVQACAWTQVRGEEGVGGRWEWGIRVILQWKVHLFKSQKQRERKPLLYRKEGKSGRGVEETAWKQGDAYSSWLTEWTWQEEKRAGERRGKSWNTVLHSRLTLFAVKAVGLWAVIFNWLICNAMATALKILFYFGAINRLADWIALHLKLWESEHKSWRALARLYCLSGLWRGRWIPDRGGWGGRGGMIVNVGTIMVNSKEYSGLYIMNAGCVPAAISVSSLFLL